MIALMGLLLAATPSPTPTAPAQVTSPGVWAFVVVGAIAVLAVLLILDMTRRVRRTRYRAEVAAMLDAEERERSTEE